VSYLLSTTLKAFSAYKTCGSASIKIYSAFLLSTSILALSISNYFFLETAAFCNLSVFSDAILISSKMVSTYIFSAFTYFCLTSNSSLRIATAYFAYLSFNKPF
jgi:hypothetical protein